MAFTRSRVRPGSNISGATFATPSRPGIWGYARFQNGDTITWRQYYGNPVGKLNVEVPFDTVAARKGWDDPHPEVNRFAFIPKGQAPQYSFGPSFLFTPLKWWKSPQSGVEYPWWGK
jgi:hypothetical protein